jgi:hypothetical protein
VQLGDGSSVGCQGGAEAQSGSAHHAIEASGRAVLGLTLPAAACINDAVHAMERSTCTVSPRRILGGRR